MGPVAVWHLHRARTTDYPCPFPQNDLRLQPGLPQSRGSTKPGSCTSVEGPFGGFMESPRHLQVPGRHLHPRSLVGLAYSPGKAIFLLSADHPEEGPK